jgi:hypothetical protein
MRVCVYGSPSAGDGAPAQAIAACVSTRGEIDKWSRNAGSSSSLLPSSPFFSLKDFSRSLLNAIADASITSA